MKIPVDFEKIIEINDPVYTFAEVMDHIDLNEYLAEKERGTGRPRYDAYTLLKVILFSFMENGYVSTGHIEKSCKTDILKSKARLPQTSLAFLCAVFLQRLFLLRYLCTLPLPEPFINDSTSDALTML